MLSALKFVKGAVAKRDFVPALTHFRINAGTVRGFNGTLGLCSPIEVDLDCAPNAQQFIKAIDACGDQTISLHMDKARLVVRAGRFKTHVDCMDAANFPQIEPKGERVEMSGTLLPALQALEGLIAIDASRPWACGILFDGEVAVATNNIVLAQYWTGFEMPRRLNLPAQAVAELVRIGEEPLACFLDGERIIFDYGEGRWLSSQLLVSQWPDVNAVIDRAAVELLPEAVPEGFFEALAEIAPFSGDTQRVHFAEGVISTSKTDGEGTQIEFSEMPSTGCYNVNQLLRLKGIAETINFSAYPLPVYFQGERTRGIILPFKV